ncbi:uncharacterized protein LOC134711478 isoform X1 [Mytilus trossulus]|uniref:uncharacterized protein LOC134711478 isoform X1 n=1 Tax=Mytilus trossulus TaxID=6551 RepID=UPI003005777B
MEFVRLCIAVGCFVTYAVGQDDSEEIRNDFVSRPKLLFCPRNATCGDIFFQRRLLKDGTRRPENRHITNCICPGTEGCNFDDDHTIFQSTTHREALCAPVSSYKTCRPGQTARQLRMNSDNLDGQSYFEILCTCPRHFNPVEGRGRIGKSTYETYPTRFDSSDYAQVRPYRCSGRRPGRRNRQNNNRNRNRQNRRSRS